MAGLTFEYSPFKSTYTVTSAYNKDRGDHTHAGIDLVVNGSDKSVVSTTSGVVKYAGLGTPNSGFNNYGNCVAIETNGYVILYAHLANNSIPSNIQVGTTVAAGTIIGQQGSTGRSTGDHLHLEIRKNGELGNTADPTPLLSGGNLSISTSEYSNYSIYDSDSNNGMATDIADIPFNPTQIVGRRISADTTQPIYAYVNIYLGDTLLSTDPPKPQIIQDFEFTVTGEGDGGYTATFTLFDDTWDTLEPLLALYFDQIYIQYGYSDGTSSERMLMMLASYSIEFENTGVLLHVAASYQLINQNLTATSTSLDTYNPTEAVKKICENQGWTVEDENFDDSEDVARDNPYNLVNEYPIQYIQSVIVPEAQSNGEIFKFYITDQKVAYFKKITYSTEDSNVVKTYIYQKGYDSPVINLSVDIKAVFGGTTYLRVSTGLTSSVIDTKTKESSSDTETSLTTTTEATGNMQHTLSTQSIPVVDSAGDTAEQMSNHLYYYVKNASNCQYEALLTIVGDPTFKLLDKVRVIILTDAGNLHHTSGIYQVNGFTDTYSNGELTTTLKLLRNGNINEGVELINPKVQVK